MLSEVRARVVIESDDGLGPDPVAVVVSLFNYANVVEECLDSVAAQEYAQLELIVVDDASNKDDSVDIAQRWMKRHRKRFGRSLLVSHFSNGGLSKTRNTGIGLSHSELALVLDADNTIRPQAIAKLRRALSTTEAAAAYSQLVLFGDEQSLGYADYWSKEFLALGPYIDAMALVRRSSWELVQGYTHIDGGWEDYDFWCKIVEHGLSAVYVPELLCSYRVHGKSMLRTETIKKQASVRNTLVLRHPWIELSG